MANIIKTDKKVQFLHFTGTRSQWETQILNNSALETGYIAYGYIYDIEDKSTRVLISKEVYAGKDSNGLQYIYNVADASKLRDVSNYVTGLKITLNGSVINTSFGATIESGDSYVQIRKSKEDANDGSIAISLKTCSVNDASDAEDNKIDGVATALDVQKYVDAQIAGLSAALEFKGEISLSTAVATLTNAATSKGDVYVATGKFTYNDVTLENGDLAIVKADAAAGTASDIIVVERNLDGAVTAAEALTEDKVILGCGDQKVKATEYSLGSDTYAATSDADTSVLATEKWVEGAVNTAAKSLTVSTADNNSVYINLLDGSTSQQTLSSVEVKKEGYVTVSAETTTDKSSITIGVKNGSVSTATEDASGLATAYDVQTYVANQLAWHILS